MKKFKLRPKYQHLRSDGMTHRGQEALKRKLRGKEIQTVVKYIK